MKKKSKIKKTIGFAVFMLVCLILGYFAGKLGASAASGVPKGTVITLAVLFIPLFFIVIAVHEAGHALAGVLVNFDFKLYVVGPFLWEKEGGKWKFKWNKNVNTAGGLVLCMPTGTENLSKRFSVYAAGGPFASVVLAVVAYGIFRLISMENLAANQSLQILAYFFLLMAFLSSFIFFVTVVPMHSSGFSTDGARVFRFLKGGDTARLEMLIIKLVSGSSSGVRPKLLDKDELNEAKALAIKLNSSFTVYMNSFFHQAAFDRGDIEEAEKYLQDYIDDADEIPEGLRNAVWLDAAFFYAFAKGDIGKAELYWNKFKHAAMIPKAQIYATEAAIAFLRNEKELVVSKIEAGFKEIPNMIDKGVGIALAEKLTNLGYDAKSLS